jgi:hypothetical protein
MENSVASAAMRKAATLVATALAMTVAGCNSAPVGERTSVYTTTMAKPIPANVYPVIEGKLPAATAQMSNEEAATQEARLTALSSARASGAISEAEYRRRVKELELLAANHGKETLKQIEN